MSIKLNKWFLSCFVSGGKSIFIMKYIIFTLFLTIAACSNTTERTKKQVTTEPKINEADNFDARSNNMGGASDEFDILSYKRKVDSLISKVLGADMLTNLTADTLQSDQMVFQELKNTSLRSLALDNEIIKYTFSLTGEHSGLKHHLIILFSQDEMKADAVYAVIEKIALEKRDVPGLTYTNDYVISMADKIYWLNTNCPYAYKNHMKFVEIFKQVKNINEIKAIECRCGKITCDTLRK